MKTILRERYGGPEVLRIAEAEIPEPGEGGVLVKVQAAGTNTGDGHIMRGKPFAVRFFFPGLTRPKVRGLGLDFAGRVEKVGPAVVGLKEGDAVFGTLPEDRFGSFAEYVCAPAEMTLERPAGVLPEEAAVLSGSGITALRALRDSGGIREGMHVLVNGASGGVGTYAVQIAKSFGATVTGVCSTANVELVRSLGADRVIDYRIEDYAADGAQYDLLVDLAAYRPLVEALSAVRPGGRYVLVGGAPSATYRVMIFGGWYAWRSGREVKFHMAKPTRHDLEALRDLVESGRVRAVVDRTFALEEVPEAMRHLEEGRPRGKVAIVI
jgi:NADPH:quinone reductase-like Zn-dependent oxidoreductase